MILDAVGADQIRSGLTTAAGNADEYQQDITGLGGILTEAADRYTHLGMAGTTVEHLRNAATQLTHAHLLTAAGQLQAAAIDFNAHDGRVAQAVAQAVADAGTLMDAAGFTEPFALPAGPITAAVAAGSAAGPDQPTEEPPSEPMSPAEYLLALEDIRNGMAWMANNDGDPHWRPSTPSPQLTAQLAVDSAADQAAERQRLPAPDRITCYTHQSWLADCVTDPSHSRPGLADGSVAPYNWCTDHRLPVQLCQRWPATVDGTPPEHAR